MIKFTLVELAPTPSFMADVLEPVVSEKCRCPVAVSQTATRSSVLTLVV